jgi:Microtubule-associated protein 70
MKTLDRELARAKVTANRVAVVVANEWKDANDKVMPVRQWLEERRFMQVCNLCLQYSDLLF